MKNVKIDKFGLYSRYYEPENINQRNVTNSVVNIVSKPIEYTRQISNIKHFLIIPEH
jgi:hypothetical protein